MDCSMEIYLEFLLIYILNACDALNNTIIADI